ncbi:ATP-binding cassette domain-containing protein [Lentibacter algarum]|uniref:ATP-binding cassette domain-containing protein n=1 Tax=Lentibacter algarum TaxID=576131 RepID=UPI001C069023|nr:ATP-binding cassette domain-containing protein [Lentibacter algarum]MBU2980525.1 ATP-binding cassette domain-containing protein [Lentibacter algarum]
MVSILPLTLSQATVSRREKRLLGPIDLTLEAGGITIVLGPNGAGKSTLLRLMHGLEKPSSGKLRYAAPRALAYSQQAFVFQTPVMLRRSVLGNLSYPLTTHKMPRAEAEKQSLTWLKRLGLGSHTSQRASQLSGGERQKLALARALIRQPELLFLDEPCANLDGAATRDIERLIIEAGASGTRIIMATHDLGQARRLADDVLFVHHGLIHEQSEAATFFDNPKTTEARSFLKGDLI